MKKQLLLIASVFISGLVMAQPSFNVKAGIASSGMRGDAVNSLQDLLDFTGGRISTTNKTGFYAGGSVNLPLGGPISIEPGLMYTQRGYQMNGDLGIKGIEFLGAGAKATLTSHYIDLPVLVKADLGGFQVFAGPQVSYLAKSDLRTTAGVLGFNVLNKTLDATSQFNQWDAAVTGGIGYQFANGLNVTAAYDHGLSRVDAGRNTNAYNHTLKLGLGFRF